MDYVKYPRTLHLPWSPGLQNDDRLIKNLDGFVGKQVVVTEKMDGENATMYSNHYHARSLDSRHHPSRDWMKAFHGSIKHLIPTDLRICGENMYAEHSVRYDDLQSYFLGFSVWDKRNYCKNWDETFEWFELLGITSVPVIWRGQFENVPWQALNEAVYNENEEGYVVRTCDGFGIEDFKHNVAKFVRKDHIQTDQHWMAKPVVPNGLLK